MKAKTKRVVRAVRRVTKKIASKSTKHASHDEAERYFDAVRSRVFRSSLVNQLADLAQQECKPGELVVKIADHSVLESFPGIRVLKVTIRTKNKKLRNCFIDHPVLGVMRPVMPS